MLKGKPNAVIPWANSVGNATDNKWLRKARGCADAKRLLNRHHIHQVQTQNACLIFRTKRRQLQIKTRKTKNGVFVQSQKCASKVKHFGGAVVEQVEFRILG